MKHLILTRGCMGSGKSYFIEQNNLEQYTIEPDRIRLLFQSPITTVDGTLAISQFNDKKVWEFVFQILEERIKKGEFTVIDGTHSRSKFTFFHLFFKY